MEATGVKGETAEAQALGSLLRCAGPDTGALPPARGASPEIFFEKLKNVRGPGAGLSVQYPSGCCCQDLARLPKRVNCASNDSSTVPMGP